MSSNDRIFVVVVAVALCLGGCLSTDDSSGTAGRGDADRIPSPLSDLGTPDAGDTGSDQGNFEWDEWGTDGSIDGVGQSPRGQALCGLSDIRTDDAVGEYSTEVPDGTWAATPVADSFGRCGDDDETILWRLTNCERISRNIDPLECDLRLVWVSRQHSADMIDRDFWGHDTPEGVTPFERMADRGISFSWAGENIANYPNLQNLHWGWMDSSGHRENILLGEFTHVGLGVIREGVGFMATEDFIGI